MDDAICLKEARVPWAAALPDSGVTEPLGEDEAYRARLQISDYYPPAVQPSTELIRHATVADLPHVAEIWYEAAVGDDANPPALPGIPSLYQHELATQELFVLERDGCVVAFAAVINRGAIAFVADLFVSAAHRSAGLGQCLLGRVIPSDGRVCCTVSSRDPRALPLYIRFGLRPWWPHAQLRAELAALSVLPPTDIEVIEAHADDPDWVRWDAEIGGRARPEDYAYWMHRRDGVPLWFARRGRIVGYGMAQTRSDDLLRYPHAVTLGPIGTRERKDAVVCVLAAVRWARERAAMARISLTGPHPAAAPLLAAGFRIVEVETFCLTADKPFFDVQRYISSGGDLF